MRILGVGVATLDIISLVPEYPPEDAEIRAITRYRARGGNVGNSLILLRQLGHDCAWAGTYAEEADGRWLLAELTAAGIDTSPARGDDRGMTPTSQVWLSQARGSRTLVHYRDLPEYSAKDFGSLDLERWDWFHFEGRAPEETRLMLDHLLARRPGIGCSLEIEKPRSGIEDLFAGPSLLLFSRHYAQARGFREPRDFLLAMRQETSARWIICAWGDQGAWGMDAQDRLYASPAYPPATLVDSLGAGDVFNAGMIHGLSKGGHLGEVLRAACQLAGRKCGQLGFDHLAVGPESPEL